MNQKRMEYFKQVALLTAGLSHANRLKVGCVAVRDNRIVATGYNGTPPGFSNVCEDENNVTLPVVSHAEENLITYAAKSGINLAGCSLFITHAPCITCSRLIFNAGFDTIYFINAYKSSEGVEFLSKLGLRVEQI